MKKINIILVGQPNVGKSSLINALCKSNLKVGNFPGVTVQKASAKIVYKNYTLEFIDLPGTYALDGYSEEEKITQNYIKTQNYDLIINILDSTNLKRNLILSTQLLECQKKMILALNMSDEAKKEGFSIDVKRLEGLIKTPSISISSRTKENLNALLDLIIQTHEAAFTPFLRPYGEQLEEELAKIQQDIEKLNLNENPRAYAVSLLQNKIQNNVCQEMVKNSQNRLFERYQSQNIDEIFKKDLLAFSAELSQQISKQKPTSNNITKSLDALLINKYLGVPIFLFLMWVLFQLTFTLGAIPMDYIEMGFGALGDLCKEYISNELLASVLADGIIGGVGAVILFLPNILILFFGIALLETTGYMSRVAFLLDGILHKFGLHGKSFIPLITGFGCSVPAFMATRTLKNKGDRLLTLFVINFMSCGARLPVYVLFIGAFFESEKAGNYLFGIYILGAFLGLLAAKFLKMTAFRGIDEPFIMEMPKYRMPNWNLVCQMSLNKAKMYLKKAGTFILLASVLIWFASNFPIQTNAPEDEKEAAELQIENSYLGQFGKTIEPIFAPLEFDWKLSVSLLSGLAAKEVMISTLGVLYALGEDLDENNENLRQTLALNIPFSTAVAYILFVMIYNPCFAATIVFAKESGKVKYMLYLFLFTCISAYIVAFIGLHVSKMLT
ncbi:ferrous iron transport protein B [Campylobacter upsaliensis]|uniref:ferrous iron transport protein B n=1 Tax=Campylobacter upsaliensis TaxID=28080 RepID=UPI00214A80E8|nr:ferrous iron transport protein B [Campylobacter upsaliensis]MCR2120262.1 ferrous iron transport protein B [Campylobacter upsaliensis]MCR2123515.1 ferrous iron transport protein B [Campylobacter upsaliensis]